MLDIMLSAKNAIESYNTELRIHSANIANMSVDGYKALNISFQTVFDKVLRHGTASDSLSGLGGTNPIQTGGGVGIANVGVNFSQGSFVTGGNLSLAVSGQGMFIVSPDNGNTKYYTRAGRFMLDANQNLVTQSGMPVYGFRRSGGVSGTGALVPISLAGLTYNQNDITFDSNGVLRQSYDSTTGTYGAELPFQIALSSFNNVSGLEQKSGNLFAETSASGQAKSPDSPGGFFGYGTVTPRNVEQSNVFYIGEIIDSMNAQRAMSGSLTVVTMINELISGVINRL